MSLSLLTEVTWTIPCSSVHDAYRTIVPLPKERISISAGSSFYFILPHFLLLYMAYLARRPDTFLIRLLFLPVTVQSILRVFLCITLSTSGRGPNLVDIMLVAVGLVLVAKAIDLACRPEGMLKIDEEKPGIPLRTPYGRHGAANDPPENPSAWQCYLPPWLYDSSELLLASRGIGWKFGAGIHVPKEYRPMGRSAFLRGTLFDVVRHYLIIDACDTFIRLIPGLNFPEGGSTIFHPELPTLQRYIISSTICFVTAASMVSSFQVYYAIITLIAVGIFSGQPMSWPPIMDNPWKSDSLHVFWAKRWHQLLRETFFVYGGFIGGFLGGDIGKLCGTFIGSGLFHTVPVFVVGGEFELSVLLFFVLQAPLLVLEKVWARTTGHRVQGFYGQAWTCVVLCIGGQFLVDAWYKVGLKELLAINSSVSPSRRFFVPFFVQLTKWMGFYGVYPSLQLAH